MSRGCRRRAATLAMHGRQRLSIRPHGSRFYRHPAKYPGPAGGAARRRTGSAHAGSAAAGPGAGRISIPRRRAPRRTTRRGCRRFRTRSAKRCRKARWRSAMPRSSTRCATPRPRPASTACSMRPTTCSMSARPRTSASGCRPMRGSTGRSRRASLRMIAATATVEIVSTATETEALLLEANLIKQLRPRFNVQLRDDKSFPYILITGDHWAPQILKHRGAQSRPGRYFGPFASAGAVNRTITALQRAFLVRSCTDAFLRKPHAALPAVPDQALLGAVHRRDRFSRLYRTGARGDRLPVRPQPRGEAAARRRDGKGLGRTRVRDARRSTATASRRCRRSSRSRASIRARVEEADVFAIHQEGGYSCVEVFFFRTGQNWGNRAYFPRAEKSFTPEEVLASFLAQFYDDKPPPKLILLSHEIEECELLADALSIKAGFKVEVVDAAARREEGADRARADQCARGAGPQAGRYRDADAGCCRAGHHARPAACAEAHRGLRQQPHPGHQCGRRHDRGGAGRLHQEPVPQVQHQVRRPDAGRRLRA